MNINCWLIPKFDGKMILSCTTTEFKWWTKLNNNTRLFLVWIAKDSHNAIQKHYVTTSWPEWQKAKRCQNDKLFRSVGLSHFIVLRVSEWVSKCAIHFPTNKQKKKVTIKCYRTREKLGKFSSPDIIIIIIIVTDHHRHRLYLWRLRRRVLQGRGRTKAFECQFVFSEGKPPKLEQPVGDKASL